MKDLRAAGILGCLIVAPIADLADPVCHQLFLAAKHPELSILARNLRFSLADTLEYLATPAGAILTVLGIGPWLLLLLLLAPNSWRRVSRERARKSDDGWLLASPLVLEGGQPARLLYREIPAAGGDSGWRVFSGNEREEFPRDFQRLQLDVFLQREPAARAVLDDPPGTAFVRDDEGGTFRQVAVGTVSLLGR